MSISKEREEKLLNFQKKYNLVFQDLELLNQAFIHTSYTSEKGLDESFSYEKLEFYGDAVLKLAVSEFLYDNFKQYQEGELTKLRAEIVSDHNIFDYAIELGFQDLILLGFNEKKQGGAKKESILACAFEALLGAIFINYKNQGYIYARDFLKNNFLEDILSVDKKMCYLNPKALLQEYTQGINHKLPEYNLIKEEGEAHKKNFYVEVSFNDEIIGRGVDRSIKKAQIEAAYNAIKRLGLVKE